MSSKEAREGNADIERLKRTLEEVIDYREWLLKEDVEGVFSLKSYGCIPKLLIELYKKLQKS